MNAIFRGSAKLPCRPIGLPRRSVPIGDGRRPCRSPNPGAGRNWRYHHRHRGNFDRHGRRHRDRCRDRTCPDPTSELCSGRNRPGRDRPTIAPTSRLVVARLEPPAVPAQRIATVEWPSYMLPNLEFPPAIDRAPDASHRLRRINSMVTADCQSMSRSSAAETRPGGQSRSPSGDNERGRRGRPSRSPGSEARPSTAAFARRVKRKIAGHRPRRSMAIPAAIPGIHLRRCENAAVVTRWLENQAAATR